MYADIFFSRLSRPLLCCLHDDVVAVYLGTGLAGAELATIANEAAISAARRGSQTVVQGDLLVSTGSYCTRFWGGGRFLCLVHT